MTPDRTLPGLYPRLAHFKVHYRGDGCLDVAVWHGDQEGLRVAADWTIYESLTAQEAQDVLCAVLDGYYGSSWGRSD